MAIIQNTFDGAAARGGRAIEIADLNASGNPANDFESIVIGVAVDENIFKQELTAFISLDGAADDDAIEIIGGVAAGVVVGYLYSRSARARRAVKSVLNDGDGAGRGGVNARCLLFGVHDHMAVSVRTRARKRREGVMLHHNIARSAGENAKIAIIFKLVIFNSNH